MENFTEKDLVEFGNYLLSEARKKSLVKPKGMPLKDIAGKVHFADLENWKATRK
jgi:hypothetical protein